MSIQYTRAAAMATTIPIPTTRFWRDTQNWAADAWQQVRDANGPLEAP